jgi:hypothetical protein
MTPLRIEVDRAGQHQLSNANGLLTFTEWKNFSDW